MKDGMAVMSFVDFLANELREGELVTKWDESLQGMGPGYEISEEELDSVIEFAEDLAEQLGG